MSDEDKVLTRVLEEATSFLGGLDDRPVAARADVDRWLRPWVARCPTPAATRSKWWRR